MRITSQNLSGASTAGAAGGTQDIQRYGSDSSSVSKSSAGEDSVELSSTLGSLSRAMKSLGASRQNIVQSLSAQYQSGTYQVDSAAISRGMVSEALSR